MTMEKMGDGYQSLQSFLSIITSDEIDEFIRLNDGHAAILHWGLKRQYGPGKHIIRTSPKILHGERLVPEWGLRRYERAIDRLLETRFLSLRDRNSLRGQPSTYALTCPWPTKEQ